MTDEPLYYAKGNEVWKRPIETPREGGGKTISIGFKVCTCTDVVGLKGAETVAKMLSLAEGHPDAYRHGWEDREADLIDGAKRVLSAPSSPGDGWVMVPIVPRDEMVRAGDAVLAQSTWPDADDIWTAMIDARPLPTEGEGTNG